MGGLTAPVYKKISRYMVRKQIISREQVDGLSFFFSAPDPTRLIIHRYFGDQLHIIMLVRATTLDP